MPITYNFFHENMHIIVFFYLLGLVSAILFVFIWYLFRFRPHLICYNMLGVQFMSIFSSGVKLIFFPAFVPPCMLVRRMRKNDEKLSQESWQGSRIYELLSWFILTSGFICLTKLFVVSGVESDFWSQKTSLITSRWTDSSLVGQSEWNQVLCFDWKAS